MGSSLTPVNPACIEHLPNIQPEHAAAWLMHWHFKTADKVAMLHRNGQIEDSVEKPEYQLEFRSVFSYGAQFFLFLTMVFVAQPSTVVGFIR